MELVHGCSLFSFCSSHADKQMRSQICTCRTSSRHIGKRGFSKKQEEDWHRFKHAGAERGFDSSVTRMSRKKGVELCEFVSLRERERSDREIEVYARQQNLPFDPKSSLSIIHSTVTSNSQVTVKKEIAEVFRSVLESR